MIKERKVALIGTGSVGTSFIYSAIHTGLASEYILIDLNKEFAKGQALDLEDGRTYHPNPFVNVKAGDYSDLKQCDLIIITAGRPQKPNETRLDMVSDNAKIMKNIALNIKKSQFNGVTIIASNPVDIMASVYQHVTKFDERKVISSGTSLDTSRLRVELSKKLDDISPRSINAYVLGEHGDSSVSVFSSATIGSQPFLKYVGNKISNKELEQIHEKMWKKAYEIIERKRATHFGIGVSLNAIATAVLSDQQIVIPVGAKLNGEYGEKGIYCGTPCVLGNKGIIRIIEVGLNDDEKKRLKMSLDTLKKTNKVALKAIE